MTNALAWIGPVVSVIAAAASIYFAHVSKKHSERSLELTQQDLENSLNAQVSAWVEQASKQFQIAGQPVDFIDSLPVNEQVKQRVYELACKRAKGKTPTKTFDEARSERST